MKNIFTYKNFLKLWAIGAFISLMIHFLFPTQFSQITNWNSSIGWQREIAIWNLGIIIIIFTTLKQKLNVYLIFLGLLALSAIFAINHFYAIVAQSSKFGNWIGFVANILAVLFGIIVIKQHEQ